MNVTFDVDKDINITGTNRRGQIKTTFNKIVAVFGIPTAHGGDKSFTEWRIQFRIPAEDDAQDFDYLVATIYDWKEQTNPARYPTDEYTFNIGGNDMDAAYYVHQLLGESPS